MNENYSNELVLTGICDNSLSPSSQVENALREIKDEFQTPLLSKIPFTEIASLGGPFAGVAETLAIPTGEGIYRCIFPKGVIGTLAMAKDGSGALGAIMNESGIAGQARWIPVEKAIGPACLKATLVAVAVIAVEKRINDIKDGQKEIIEILERDRKSQLLVDYDLLSSYMADYKYYWENSVEACVKLNQVNNIKRNALKEIKSYSEQLEDMVAEKKSILKLQNTTQKIEKILDRFVHYKLALNVFALSEYMEVMLAQNFQAEYLAIISDELRDKAIYFKDLYTKCYDKIEMLKTEALTAQASGKVADVARDIGSFIGKIPVVKNGPVDEFLVSLGDSIDDIEAKKLAKTLSFFIQYKVSGITPVADHIDMISKVANKPVMMLCNKNEISFHELQEAV